MADPFSIATSCVGLLAAIATATVRINGFVRTARDARADLDTVSRELGSLRTVLELIQADAESSQDQLPPTIVHHLCEVLSNCNGAVADIETVLKKYEKKDAMTSGRWALSGKGDVEKLKAHLEAHTSALGLVLDMMNLVISIKVQQDTCAIQAQTTDIKLDTANILLKIEQLQARLPNMGEERDDYMLQRYLEEMTTYTEEMLSGVDHRSEPEVVPVVADTETPKTPSHSTGLLSTDAEMAALEEFLETEVKPTPSTSTSSATVRPSITEQSTIGPPPKRPGVVLFHGNLVLDIGLPQEVLNKVPHGERDEFTHVRYTAVTCDPQDLKTRGYSLRASLFSNPRSTDILLSVFFNSKQDPTTLPGVLCRVWDAVDQLYGKTPNGYPLFDESAWRRVILHLHFAAPPKGLTQAYLNDISALPARYADSGPGSSNGASSFSGIDLVKGESVLWHMYEYTTQLRLQSASPARFSMRTASTCFTPYKSGRPLQTIVTHGRHTPPNQVSYEQTAASWKAWRRALREHLRATVTVSGIAEETSGYLKPWSLVKAWQNDGRGASSGSCEVALTDLWDWSDRWNGIKALVSA